MMATTHALVGVAIAAIASLVVGDLPLVAVVAAAAGGFFPDLDLYAGHRKTLHFPVYFSVGAAIAGLVAIVVASPSALAAALFLTAAAVHSVMDAFGGGLELKPWLGTSDRAVYSHYHRRWYPPKRWIRYDGAPEDFGLALVAAAPALALFDGLPATGVLGLLAISAVYVLVRKPLVTVAQRLVPKIPEPVLGHVPERFVEDLR